MFPSAMPFLKLKFSTLRKLAKIRGLLDDRDSIRNIVSEQTVQCPLYLSALDYILLVIIK